MKKYIIPTTESLEINTPSLMQEFVGSGSGQTENPTNPDPNMGLAPIRPWAF